MKPASIQILFVLLVSTVAYHCAHSPPKREQAAPPIFLQLSALDGGQINLQEFRGKRVILHLFTTWAIAAQQDVPQLQRLSERPEAPVIIGIALDPDGYRLVAPWRTAMQVTYQITLADERIRDGHSSIGRIKQVPTTFVLDRNGAIERRIVGPLSKEDIEGF